MNNDQGLATRGWGSAGALGCMCGMHVRPLALTATTGEGCLALRSRGGKRGARFRRTQGTRRTTGGWEGSWATPLHDSNCAGVVLARLHLLDVA